MSSRRTARIAEAIREQVSSTILFDLKDPRVRDVTVTHAEVSADVRSAKVYVSIMGDEQAESLCMHGLNSARGFIQAKVADRLQTRYTPILRFIVDRGVKRSIEASRVLRDSLAENETAGPAATPVENTGGDLTDTDETAASRSMKKTQGNME